MLGVPQDQRQPVQVLVRPHWLVLTRRESATHGSAARATLNTEYIVDTPGECNTSKRWALLQICTPHTKQMRLSSSVYGHDRKTNDRRGAKTATAKTSVQQAQTPSSEDTSRTKISNQSPGLVADGEQLKPSKGQEPATGRKRTLDGRLTNPPVVLHVSEKLHVCFGQRPYHNSPSPLDFSRRHPSTYWSCQ